MTKIDTKGLCQLISKSGKTKRELAFYMGIPLKSLNFKIYNLSYWQADEIEKAVEFLELPAIGALKIFFYEAWQSYQQIKKTKENDFKRRC